METGQDVNTRPIFLAESSFDDATSSSIDRYGSSPVSRLRFLASQAALKVCEELVRFSLQWRRSLVFRTELAANLDDAVRPGRLLPVLTASSGEVSLALPRVPPPRCGSLPFRLHDCHAL
jgi:hypothetical protein